MKIHTVYGQEILDSRGNPTLEATVVLVDESVGRASVPSGASTGQYEALELRDGDKNRYNGKGVLNAVHNVKSVIREAVVGKRASFLEIDRILRELDGTEDMSRLGANAALAVSLAVAKAAAASASLPLYRYLGGRNGVRLPVPLMNILNGGAHASNNLDVQEFMIVPLGFPTFSEALRAGTEIYHALGRNLKKAGKSTAVGDEGGFAPDLSEDKEAIEYILQAIRDAGYDTDRVKIALDVAASEWADGRKYHLPKAGTDMTTAELVQKWDALARQYPIFSIEDGVGETDRDGWRLMTEVMGDRTLLVGDDFFVTNPVRLRAGIEAGEANAVLVKPNQIGSLSKTLEVIRMASEYGYRSIVSHRSGETGDTSIADIAVATNAGFIKTGAPCRYERVAKYNRLLRIEAELGESAVYGV
jgi:enolase